MNKLEVRKVKHTLKYQFNDAESLAHGRHLAEVSEQARQIEADKKRVVKDFDAKLAQAEAEMSLVGNKLTSGYEYREVECTETFGEPDDTKKTIRRHDSPAGPVVVAVKELTNEEKQRTLEFAKEQTIEEVTP